ncbi:exo-alpha-sialidase [Paenibacillus sp. IB182496]|uniref:Exo-alpha-sialidase n=1 Tax=Paenibacillus sabuli TaxID=2772509 RepID=A0A927GSJ5_9BACL|nr:sialidase family protein [Paenibacillus sabuli]MBD2846633.1 exo-alpha-sialidase [Paenibacillus sabuli]
MNETWTKATNRSNAGRGEWEDAALEMRVRLREPKLGLGAQGRRLGWALLTAALGCAVFAASAPAADAAPTPTYKHEQVLADGDALASKTFLAFPTIVKVDDSRVVISYKRGDQHSHDSSALLETMVFNPATGTVVSVTATDSTAAVVNQNPELVQMPGGTLVNYVDWQQGGTKDRLGVRVFASGDDGDTFASAGALPAVGGYEYGYTFDDYVDGSDVYMLAMSFPELGSPRAVHMLKSSDDGATWSHLKNLNTALGYSFNESALEKYGSTYIIAARGDAAGSTKLFKTDAAFDLLDARDLSAEYPGLIGQIGRPKLFVQDGGYYLLCRNVQGGDGVLTLYELDPDTLELVSAVELDRSIVDAYYAEPYFQEALGETYFNVVTYKPGAASTVRSIVRLEYEWEELLELLVPIEDPGYWQDGLDGEPIGSPPGQWTVGTAGGTVTVADVPGAGDRSLALSDGSASTLVEAIRPFTVTTATEVTAAYRVLADASGGVFGFSLRDAAGVNAITVALDGSGQLYTYNGGTKTNVAAYSADTWYEIEAVANLEMQTFDLYVDGVPAAAGYGFRSGASELASVRINSTGASTGAAYFDDVSVKRSFAVMADFGDNATGAAPAAWSVGTAGGTVTVEDVPGGGDRSLALSDGSTGALVDAVRAFNPTTTDEVTAAYRVMADASGGVFGFSLRDAAGVNAITVALDGSGQLYTYDGGTKSDVAAYSADTWYEVEVVANLEAQTFDLYVDGVLAAADYAFRHAAPSFADLRLNSTGASVGTAYFDELTVRESFSF